MTLPATPPTATRPRRLWSLLLVSLALVLVGGGVAAGVQSAGGDVDVTDVRFTGTDGQTLSALLYTPAGASADDPAPGILAVHGYINSRETQDAFAIELSRRGYVVLALDQSGHGFSGGAAYDNGYGGPAGLAYLHSLDIVDPDQIGLEGHSMGGWTVLSAAAAYPDYYRSVVLVGSSTGLPLAPDGTPEFPRNLALVYGEREEFSLLMWNEADPGDVQSNPKMMSVFGTDEPVGTDRVYGSVDDGTARVLYRPSATHPGLTIDPTAVRHTIDWFDETLAGGQQASGQVWWLKELGTLVAFVGGIGFLFAAGGLLLRSRFFGTLAGNPAPGVGMRGAPWYGAALVTAVVSAVTFFPLQIWGNELLPANAFLPQDITTGVAFWALGNAVVSLALFVVWHVTSGRAAGGGAQAYGLAGPGGFSWRVVGKSALLATVVTGGLYGLLALSDALFLTDFRFYVFQLHLMDAARFRVFLTYLVPFTVYALVTATVLHAQLRSAAARGTGRRMMANGVVLALGVLVLTVANYLPLVAGGTLWIDTQPLLSIVAFQFVPLLFVVGLLVTFFADRTGTVYTGAFVAAILISWNNVAGTANQVEPAPWAGGGQLVRVWLPIAAAVVLVVVAVVRRRDTRTPAGPSEEAAGSDRLVGDPAVEDRTPDGTAPERTAEGVGSGATSAGRSGVPTR